MEFFSEITQLKPQIFRKRQEFYSFKVFILSFKSMIFLFRFQLVVFNQFRLSVALTLDLISSAVQNTLISIPFRSPLLVTDTNCLQGKLLIGMAYFIGLSTRVKLLIEVYDRTLSVADCCCSKYFLGEIQWICSLGSTIFSALRVKIFTGSTRFRVNLGEHISWLLGIFFSNPMSGDWKSLPLKLGLVSIMQMLTILIIITKHPTLIKLINALTQKPMFIFYPFQMFDGKSSKKSSEKCEDIPYLVKVRLDKSFCIFKQKALQIDIVNILIRRRARFSFLHFTFIRSNNIFPLFFSHKCSSTLMIKHGLFVPQNVRTVFQKFFWLFVYTVFHAMPECIFREAYSLHIFSSIGIKVPLFVEYYIQIEPT